MNQNWMQTFFGPVCTLFHFPSGVYLNWVISIEPQWWVGFKIKNFFRHFTVSEHLLNLNRHEPFLLLRTLTLRNNIIFLSPGVWSDLSELRRHSQEAHC